MGFRAALHQAGAAALSQLLQFPEPAAEQRPSPARAVARGATANCARDVFSLIWAWWSFCARGLPDARFRFDQLYRGHQDGRFENYWEARRAA